MTETKKKIGRPATGRDRACSFRLPEQLIIDVRTLAKQIGRSQSEVVREAIELGVNVIRGEKPVRGLYLPATLRPPHRAEIHEAGHAVAAFLSFDIARQIKRANIEQPSDMLKYIMLKGDDQAYCAFHDLFSDQINLRIGIAGAVAQAKAENRSFKDVWNSDASESDHHCTKGSSPVEFDEAVAEITFAFNDPVIWAGLRYLARSLSHGKTHGHVCWELYQNGCNGLPNPMAAE
jgi:hypothetical protein